MLRAAQKFNPPRADHHGRRIAREQKQPFFKPAISNSFFAHGAEIRVRRAIAGRLGLIFRHQSIHRAFREASRSPVLILPGRCDPTADIL